MKPETCPACLVMAAFLLLQGCGSRKSEEPAQAPKAPAPVEEEKTDTAGMAIEGLTGSLSHDEVVMVMDQDGVMKLEMCLNWIYTRRDFMFGEVEFLFKVRSDGTVAEVRFTRSEVGDFELEKCLLKKMSYIKFPHPKGGATEVTYSFTLDLPSGTRKPDSISSGGAKEALADFEGQMKDCTGGSLEGLELVLYLGETYSEEVEVPGKKKKTETRDFCRVLALGGIAPDGASEGAIQCIMEASKGWKVPLDAGTYVSKTSVSY